MSRKYVAKFTSGVGDVEDGAQSKLLSVERKNYALGAVDVNSATKDSGVENIPRRHSPQNVNILKGIQNQFVVRIYKHGLASLESIG